MRGLSVAGLALGPGYFADAKFRDDNGALPVIPEFSERKYPGPRATGISVAKVDLSSHIPPMRDHVYWVYILASERNGTLYTGVTSDLVRRVQEHREGLVPGFTKRYRVKLLVWNELHHGINVAIQREKRIKRWHRRWKLELIEAQNPQWRDQWLELTEP